MAVKIDNKQEYQSVVKRDYLSSNKHTNANRNPESLI